MSRPSRACSASTEWGGTLSCAVAASGDWAWANSCMAIACDLLHSLLKDEFRKGCRACHRTQLRRPRRGRQRGKKRRPFLANTYRRNRNDCTDFKLRIFNREMNCAVFFAVDAQVGGRRVVWCFLCVVLFCFVVFS